MRSLLSPFAQAQPSPAQGAMYCLRHCSRSLPLRHVRLATRAYTSSGSDQPHAKLSSGGEIPLLGLGTWKHTPEQAGPAVERALDLGYRWAHRRSCSPLLRA